MAIARSYDEQSPIEVVIARVRSLLEDAGYAAPVMFGARYLQEPGSGPRVVIVTDQEGQIGPATEHGYVASETVRCDVYVRNVDGGDDIERFAEVRALQDVVVTAIERAASGRYQWVSPRERDDSPVRVSSGMGAGLALAFEYTRNIRADEKIMSVARASADASPKKPNIPPGVIRALASGNASTVEPS